MNTGSNKILSKEKKQGKKAGKSSFSVAHVTQDAIIFVVNKYKKMSSKVVKQEKYKKYSTS